MRLRFGGLIFGKAFFFGGGGEGLSSEFYIFFALKRPQRQLKGNKILSKHESEIKKASQLNNRFIVRIFQLRNICERKFLFLKGILAPSAKKIEYTYKEN